MPGFNENGYLQVRKFSISNSYLFTHLKWLAVYAVYAVYAANQAYVSGFDLNEPSQSPSGKFKVKNEVKTQLKLIMVATSADPEVFKELMAGKKYLEDVSCLFR